MKKLYSTTMINTGGRSGEVHAPDGSLSMKVAAPGSGAADATNPEQLFAAGYGACFNGALEAVLLKNKIKAKSTITTTVSLYEKGPLDFGIGVEIEGSIEGLSQEETQKYLELAHQVCPYSKATRNNIEVTLKAV